MGLAGGCWLGEALQGHAALEAVVDLDDAGRRAGQQDRRTWQLDGARDRPGAGIELAEGRRRALLAADLHLHDQAELSPAMFSALFDIFLDDNCAKVVAL